MLNEIKTLFNSMLAVPVWQMIYFSFGSTPLFLLLAYFSPYLNMLAQYFWKDDVVYQQSLMCLGFLGPLRVSVTAFFIGQRKTKIIVCSALIGSITNIILDYLLIYGVPGAIPSLDCSCAAIDTNISEFTKVMILISIFFNSHNRKNLKY